MLFQFESLEFKNIMRELSVIAERVELDPEHYSETAQTLIPYIRTAEQVLNPNIDLSAFDTYTEYSRKQPVSDFVKKIVVNLNTYKNSKKDEDLITLLSLALNLLYVYFSEMEFRLGGFNQSISLEIGSFSAFVSDYFQNDTHFRRYLQYAERDIPFAIVQEIFKSNEITNLGTLNENVEEASTVIKKWEADFEQKQNTVKDLEERLEKAKVTYDFLGLSKGFQHLYEQKQEELKKVKETYSFVAATMFCIPFIEFSVLIFGVIYFKGNIPSAMWLISIPFLTLILITLYLVKISLQDKRSVQSQMMQLELRMALCQFIHNYADDSEKLHKKNEKGFEKFENIIFSPLVSSDDKIPTTFDGMEQLAKLVSEFRK